MKKSIIPETVKIIKTRKSVRNFNEKPVGKEELVELVKAGMAAPTAVNCQPWEFIIVTDRSLLDKLGDVLPYTKMIYKAGAAIVVCSIPAKAHRQFVEYAILDSALASENILLAAEALKLGAVWTAAYPYSDRMESVRTILNIPKEIIPLNVIPIGHPTGEDKPKEKYRPEKIHWEKW